MEQPDLTMVRHLKSKGRFSEARALLEEWLAEDPENPRLWLEMAFILDAMGQEPEAIGCYQRALDGGLDRAFVLEAYIGLGMNWRLTGHLYEARKLLEKAVAEYPDFPSARVFYALLLYADGNPGDAIRALLDVVLDVAHAPDIRQYRAVLKYYRDHLHESRSMGTPDLPD
ncbi:MAG: tetratricopeptide repeat protein [Thermaerobacter sp.]|nr:tetratricopeptide repeat protein [Thermaerobacter sp.]